MNGKPLVSICTLTYNHEKFIRQCLDGFLMQQCDFRFEILIHDDASNDSTQKIIDEYKARHPDLIRTVYQETNQYSRGTRGFFPRFLFPKAKGKYIALCEGDDYWIDSLKLQKQVDFLERNTDYGLCSSRYIKVHVDSGRVEEDGLSNFISDDSLGFEVTAKSMHEVWATKTLTVLFRRELLNNEVLTKYKYGRDVHTYYEILKKKNGFCLKDITGVYQIHGGGIFSLLEVDNKMEISERIYQEMLELNPDDEIIRDVYWNSISNLLNRKLTSLKKPVIRFEYIRLVVRHYKHFRRPGVALLWLKRAYRHSFKLKSDVVSV